MGIIEGAELIKLSVLCFDLSSKTNHAASISSQYDQIIDLEILKNVPLFKGMNEHSDIALKKSY